MADADSHAVVRRYYDADPRHEWDRLDRHPFELSLTLGFLDRYIAPVSTILDVGGGPGRYAVELARRGHTVDLLDLSPASVELAAEMARECAAPVRSFQVGNATDLGAFRSASYDVVLNMGPLYHLVREEDRLAALRESIRVLKPGGVLAVAFISSFAHIYDTLAKDPGLIAVRPGLSDGCRSSRSRLESDGRHFTDGYLIEPFDVEPLMACFPLEKLAIIGAEGVVTQSERAIIEKGERIVQEWIALCMDIADTREAVASSIHVTYFGRRRYP